jgi:hypothetical protein
LQTIVSIEYLCRWVSAVRCVFYFFWSVGSFLKTILSCVAKVEALLQALVCA